MATLVSWAIPSAGRNWLKAKSARVAHRLDIRKTAVARPRPADNAPVKKMVASARQCPTASTPSTAPKMADCKGPGYASGPALLDLMRAAPKFWSLPRQS